MMGEAKRKVAHIPHGVPDGTPLHALPPVPAAGDAALAAQHAAVAAVPPAEALLTAYEAVFLPPLAGRIALTNYERAHQKEGEPVMQWHAWLRNLAFLAHPELAAAGADPEHDATLIRRFSEGLNSLEAAQFLTLHEAPDYTCLLYTSPSPRDS